MVVKELRKRKASYEVTLSNDEKIICPESVILKYKLVPKYEFDDNILDDIKEDTIKYRLYDIACNYILKEGVKPYKKMKEYLFNKGGTKQTVDFTLNLLKENKILDDEICCKNLIYHYMLKLYGKDYIFNILKSQGLNEDIILHCLNLVDENDFKENLLKLIDKYKYKYNFKDYKDLMKFKRFLYNKGYGIELINSVEGVFYENR